MDPKFSTSDDRM